MRFSGLRASLFAAVTLAGVALTVPAASAATAGGHGHGLRPQVFTLVISTKTPDGVVNAYGPIRGRDGKVMASVSVVGDSARMRAMMRRATTLVVESARVISRRLGYSA